MVRQPCPGGSRDALENIRKTRPEGWGQRSETHQRRNRPGVLSSPMYSIAVRSREEGGTDFQACNERARKEATSADSERMVRDLLGSHLASKLRGAK